MTTPGPRGSLPGLPLVLLCIGLLLLVIASTIVLSLIPVYLPTRKLNAICTSDPFSSTFNINGGVLPSGELSSNNQAALQSAINQFLANQPGFSHCTVVVRNGNVGSCPSSQQLSQGRRRRRQESDLVRKVRQTNNNCKLTTSLALNCGCTCISSCLRRKVAQLQALLLSASIPVTFPDPTSTSVTLTGSQVPTNPTTTTTTSSMTSDING